MKQKEKWAEDFIEKKHGSEMYSIIETQMYIAWIAGFEFAKKEILRFDPKYLCLSSIRALGEYDEEYPLDGEEDVP